jgi:hypothetical protein
MSDDILTVKLTAREIDLLHQCISTNIETVKRRHDPTDPMISELIQELGELSDDLLEQRFRPEDPDLFMDPVDFAAKHDIEPGQIVICDAEINVENATSRAASRRALKFVPPGPLGAKGDRPAPQPTDRSEMQDVDVWDANDPRNW